MNSPHVLHPYSELLGLHHGAAVVTLLLGQGALHVRQLRKGIPRFCLRIQKMMIHLLVVGPHKFLLALLHGGLIQLAQTLELPLEHGLVLALHPGVH